MSKKKEKKLKVVDHRHCKVCGKAIPPDREFCSSKCEEIERKVAARQKRMRNILLMVYVLVFLILLAMMALRGLG